MLRVLERLVSAFMVAVVAWTSMVSFSRVCAWIEIAFNIMIFSSGVLMAMVVTFSSVGAAAAHSTAVVTGQTFS